MQLQPPASQRTRTLLPYTSLTRSLPVRAQREAGVGLLLVPSCTGTQAGATRVGVGCMARALENRMFIAQAVTSGAADWSPALDTNTGEATIYAPMDRGFPEDGIQIGRAHV